MYVAMITCFLDAGLGELISLAVLATQVPSQVEEHDNEETVADEVDGEGD